MRARTRPRRARQRRDPYTSDRRTPIEILSRLAGRTCTDYTTLRNSGGAVLTDLDIAAAIACARDKLGSSMAMAIACQRPEEWDHVHARGHGRLVADLRGQRELPGVIDGPYLFRARIALHDGFEELLFPRKRMSYRDAAKLWNNMSQKVYAFILHRAVSLLESAANTAAADATKFLFRTYVERSEVDEPVVLRVNDDGAISMFTARRVASTGMRGRTDDEDDLLDLLLTEAATRQRLPGVLTLRGCVDAALVQPHSQKDEPR